MAGSPLLVLALALSAGAQGLPGSKLVLQHPAGEPGGPRGWLFVEGATTEVAVVQLQPLADSDRTWDGLLVATEQVASPGVRRVLVSITDAEDLPPGIATTRARISAEDVDPYDVDVEVQTRTGLWVMFGLVLVGASVQVVARLVRPQLDAIAEVRPMIAELTSSLDAERKREDRAFRARLNAIATELARAMRPLAYQTRQARIDAVTKARADLVAALDDLAARKRLLIDEWGAVLAAAATPWRLPSSIGGQDELRASAHAIRELLDRDDVGTARNRLADLGEAMSTLATAIRRWRDDVRPLVLVLQTPEAPLPPAPSLIAGLGEARAELDAEALVAPPPVDLVGVVAAGDRAGAALGRAVRQASDVLRALIPRVQTEARKHAPDDPMDLSALVPRLPATPDPTVDNVRALAAVAAELLTTLCDWTDRVAPAKTKNPMKVLFRAGTPLTAIAKLDRGGLEAVDGTEPGDLEEPPEDEVDAPPETPPPPSELQPGVVPGEWGFDSSTPLALVVEIGVSLGLVLLLGWLAWSRSWYGTPLQLGEAIALGLGTNLALSAVLPLVLGPIVARPGPAVRRSAP